MRDAEVGQSRYITKALERQNREGVPSRAEEAALLARISSGDEAAANELAERNAKYAVKMAARYRGRGVPIDDLFSAAMTGLIIAARNFPQNKKWHYLWSAHYQVQQQLVKANRIESGCVVLPMNMLREIVKRGRGGKSNYSDERLDLGEAAQNSFSIHGNPDVDWSDFDPHSGCIDDGFRLVESRDECEQLELLATEYLDDRQRDILYRRSGYFGNVETYSEISADYGITKQRVHSVFQQAQKIMIRAVRNARRCNRIA